MELFERKDNTNEHKRWDYEADPPHLNDYIEPPRPNRITSVSDEFQWFERTGRSEERDTEPPKAKPYYDLSQVDRKDDIQYEAKPPPRWRPQDAILAASARLAHRERTMKEVRSPFPLMLYGMSTSTSAGLSVSERVAFTAQLCEPCIGRGLGTCKKDNTELYCGTYPPCQHCAEGGHESCDARVPRNGCWRYPACAECRVRGRSFCHWANEFKSPDCQRSCPTGPSSNQPGQIERAINPFYFNRL